MPKLGAKLPWRIRFRYDHPVDNPTGDPISGSRPFYGREDAEAFGTDIAKRGGTATLDYVDPQTGARSTVATFEPAPQAPQIDENTATEDVPTPAARLTPVRCYVLDLVEAEEITINRNGALEPSINGYGKAKRPFTEGRMLIAVRGLHQDGLIRFAEEGLMGVYQGEAKLTSSGRKLMPTVHAKQALFAKHAAERAELEQRRAEELAALRETEQEPAEDAQDDGPFEVQRIAAAERVRAQLDLYRSKLGADLNVAAIMVRVSDDTVVSLDTADLLMLCDAVAGPR